VGYVVLVEGGLQALFGHIDIPFVDIPALEIGRKADSIPRGVIIGGMVIGSLYALVAMGIILVYRANRVINFAQASLGAVPATLAILLIARRGVPYLVAVPIAIVGAAALGAGVEVTVIRRFARSPRLILTVATLGVGVLLSVLDFFVKQWVTGDVIDVLTLKFNTPFEGWSIRIGPTTLNGNHIAAIVVVALLVAAVGSFLRFSDVGIAIRASAENRDRAAVLGIPVATVSTVVWAMAASLSAIGVFLRAPLSGLQFGGSVSLFVLMFGLAAAVMARMEHLPTALVAGMFIGIVDRVAVFSTNSSAIAIAIMLPLVLVALLVQRKQLGRAFEMDSSGFALAREYRPIPVELRDLPEVRVGRAIVMTACALAAIAFPYVIGTLESGMATRMIGFAIIAVSLVILTGWAGQISLGQFGLAGIGAAVAGGLAANHGVDFFVTLLAAGAVTAVTAILIGLPALRIQGLFLAVTTLSFALAVQHVVLKREFFGWLLPGTGRFVEPPVLWGRFDLSQPQRVSVFGLYHFVLGAEQKLYYVGLVMLIVVLSCARSLRRLRSGRIIIGSRDNARLIQAFGINLAQSRLAAFAISGFIAALGGCLLAYQQASVDSLSFSADQSVQVLVMAVIGGIGTLLGAVVGVVLVLGLPLLPGLRDIDQIQQLVSGFGVLAVLLLVPGGASQVIFGWRDTFLRWVAVRRGLHVPSLVADSLVLEGEPVLEVVDLDAPVIEAPRVPMLVD
jgi:branched-chain amino acid transport system permease protein